MKPLPFFIVWCFIYSGAIAKSEKRQVSAPHLLRGGFAGSSGPYGNEASASTLNYQTGNQGNYNNVDANSGYNNYANYNGPSGNIPVQEQGDLPPQNVRVPVWSPPSPSENPYTAPPQHLPNSAPQSELIQIPIQQQQQQLAQGSYQFEPSTQQQQAYIPQEQIQQGYADQTPQQYPGPPAYQNNAPIYLGASPSTHDASAYRSLPVPDSYNSGIPSQTNLPLPDLYNSGLPSQANHPPISAAANIAAAYNNALQVPQGRGISSPISHGLPSLYGRGFPLYRGGVTPSISSGTPSRFVGKSLGSSSISSTLGGGLHSLDDVLAGGVGGFDTSSFGSSFGGSFGHSGFDLGSLGSNYFGGGLGGFNGFSGFGNSPFSNSFSFGGLKGGLRGSSSKFPSIGSVSTSLPNSIPGDIKNGGNIPSQQIPLNLPSSQNDAIPTSNVHAGPQNIPSQQNAINQQTQPQSAKN